mmetsp:Transcript_11310/g.21891  ORF Transcript_11310/g.21891 Transcript_11310/m.21891 type:complete len:206 (-) Transcript_11310:12-629(-)
MPDVHRHHQPLPPGQAMPADLGLHRAPIALTHLLQRAHHHLRMRLSIQGLHQVGSGAGAGLIVQHAREGGAESLADLGRVDGQFVQPKAQHRAAGRPVDAQVAREQHMVVAEPRGAAAPKHQHTQFVADLGRGLRARRNGGRPGRRRCGLQGGSLGGLRRRAAAGGQHQQARQRRAPSDRSQIQLGIPKEFCKPALHATRRAALA